MRATSADDPLLGAVQWVESLLVGSLATTCAIFAVAALGFAMLQGYLPWWRCARVVIASFILFSAGAIAQGLVGLAASPGEAIPVEENVSQYRAGSPPQTPYDPYAGAAVPNQPAGGLLD